MAYLAPALDHLVRNELDVGWPRRGSADGWIGDAAHSNRVSDHNPDRANGGIVRAVDIDIRDIDVDDFIADIIADNRTAYVIHKGRIWTPGSKWRTYTGSNPHNSHIHISLKHGRAYETDRTDWLMAISAAQMKELKDHMTAAADAAVARHARFITGLPTGEPLVDQDGNPATLTAIRRAQTVIYDKVK